MKVIDPFSLKRGDEVIIKGSLGIYFLDEIVQVSKRPGKMIILKGTGMKMEGSSLEFYEASKKNKTLMMLKKTHLAQEEE